MLKTNGKISKTALGTVAAVAVSVGIATLVGNSVAGAYEPEVAPEFAAESRVFQGEMTLDIVTPTVEPAAVLEPINYHAPNADEIVRMHAISEAVLADRETGSRQISAYGLDLIKFFEGYSSTGYLLGDGVCTIGWGSTVPEGSIDCEAWEIDEYEASDRLLEHIEKFEKSVDSYFTRDLNQHQFDALVAFSYNVGEAYKKYDWSHTPDDAYFGKTMMLYVNPAPFREGLTIRRTAEVELFNASVDEQPIPQMIEKLALDRLERDRALAAEGFVNTNPTVKF